jgi:hypothetical protein
MEFFEQMTSHISHLAHQRINTPLSLT